MSDPTDAAERAALDLLMRGFMVSRTLRLAADLGVADALPAEESATLASLAARLGVLEAQLARVLRALSAFGVFAVEGLEVRHTARSQLLRRDAPGSLHHAARFWTAPGSWRAWERLDAAMVGEVPHEAAWRTGRFDWLASEPDEARRFDAAMAQMPDDRHALIAAHLDLDEARVVADVGGGNGETLRRVLAVAPGVRGVLLDRAHVVEALTPAQRLDGRIETIAGDFRDAVPSGADIYLLVRVLHDWPDDGALTILRRCRDAMRDDARLVVVEHLLPEAPSAEMAAIYLSDLQMMAMFGGARERSAGEFGCLLRDADLRVRQIVETGGPFRLIEASPA